MKRFRYLLPIIAITALVSACRELPNPFMTDQLLAKVDRSTLYLSEIATIFPAGISADDSVALLESYVDMWVRRELKIARAEELFEGREDIEKMVEDYRNSLLCLKIEQIYGERVDTVITEAQIENYYADYQHEFKLDRPIVKGIVVSMPDNFRLAARIRDQITSSDGEKHQNVLDICAKNDLKVWEATSWTDFSEMLSQLPLSQSKNYDNLLTPGKVIEFVDKGVRYIASVRSSKSPGDLSPAESSRTKDMIRAAIILSRRSEALRAFEDSLYNVAAEKGRVTLKTE